MKFSYGVKHNGVFYPAGTDVPVGVEEPKKEVKAEPKVEVDKPLPKDEKPTSKKRNKK